MPNILLIGGGGHCRSCVDVIESQGYYQIGGIVDVEEKRGENVLGHPVLGTDNDLQWLIREFRTAFISLGHMDSVALREEKVKLCEENHAEFPVILSPHARVSPHAKLGKGTIIMHHAVVNAGARIGEHCIINTGAVVEHDATVGDFCHIMTGVILNGGVRVGDRTFVGSRAVVTQDVTLPSDSFFGAGSLVAKTLSAPGRYAGSPVRGI